MSFGIVVGASLIACSSSRDAVAQPAGATGDASDGLLRRDDSMEIPCEPRRILTEVCQKCHTRPETRNGAPFPLQWRSDVLATYGGVEIRALMLEQLAAGRMPLAPVTIEAGDRQKLVAWLEAGAPAVAPTTCIDGGTPQAGSIDAAIESDGGEGFGDDAGETDAAVTDGGAAADAEEEQ